MKLLDREIVVFDFDDDGYEFSFYIIHYSKNNIKNYRKIFTDPFYEENKLWDDLEGLVGNPSRRFVREIRNTLEKDV